MELPLLTKELKIVEKYSVQIRDFYEEFLEKKKKLTKQMDDEIKEVKKQLADEERANKFGLGSLTNLGQPIQKARG